MKKTEDFLAGKDTQQYKLQNEQYDFPYHWAQFGDRFNHFSNYHGKIYYTVFMRHIMNVISDLAPSSILDIGCGDGVLLSHLQEEWIGTSWCGVDLSANAISFAKAFNKKVDWLCGDFQEVVGNNKYSLVTCTEVLEHIPDEMVSGFLYNMFSHVEEDGKVLITVPTISKPVSKKHFRHYSIELLEDELREAGVGYKVVSKHNYIKRTWLWNLYDRIFCGKRYYWKINYIESLAYGYFKRSASRVKDDYDGEKLIVVLENIS